MSNINPSSINITYPIAGQDNNSQGFRDNFANTATNFTFAAAEITDLQNKALLKSALTGSTLNNNLQGALISNAVISGFSESILDLGTVSGAISINATTASFQRITMSASTTASFAGFPAAGNYGKLRLEIVVTNTSYTLTIPSTVTLGVAGVVGLSTNVITFPAVGAYLYEFSTFDGGGSYFIVDLLQNRSSMNANLSVTGNISATGSITGGSNVTVNANVTPISSQPASLSGTLLRLVNSDTNGCRALIDTYNSAGQSPGVSGRMARGTAAGPTAVQSGDNFATFTGHGYGATSFQTASTGMVGFQADGATFSDTSQPTAITFQVTPSGSVTKAEKMRLSNLGVLTLSGAQSGTNNTTGTLVVTGDVGASGSVRFANFVQNIVTKTSTYAFGATDGTVFANASTAGFTITLPSPTLGNVGRLCYIKKIDNTSNLVTVNAASGNVDGGANVTMGSTGTYPAMVFQSDGTNWWVVSSYKNG